MTDASTFSKIRIGIASPDEVRSWSTHVRLRHGNSGRRGTRSTYCGQCSSRHRAFSPSFRLCSLTSLVESSPDYFVGSAVAAAVGSAATTLNFTSRQLPLSLGSQTFMSRFSIFAWNVPGSNMSFGLSGTSS